MTGQRFLLASILLTISAVAATCATEGNLQCSRITDCASCIEKVSCAWCDSESQASFSEVLISFCCRPFVWQSMEAIQCVPVHRDAEQLISSVQLPATRMYE